MCKDKIQDMYVGQEFKNYKAMCSWLGESIKAGSSKKAQIKEWKCSFDFDTIGQKIIITEIYNEPKKKIDHRGGNSKPYKHFDIGIYKPDRTMDKLKGVYIIQGEQVVFKKLDVIYEGKNYVLSAENKDREYLSLYDEIIVDGVDSDGK